MKNLEINNNLFNGIYYFEGNEIYIFNDGIQENKKIDKTIIISNSSNSYLIEIFNNKFLYDCISEADLSLFSMLKDDKLIVTENFNKHIFYYDNEKLLYKYEKHNDNDNNYQEFGFFIGLKINI